MEEEKQLIQHSQAGEMDSFNRLVEKYQALAYNLAWRWLGQRAAAEDVTQEAFISAWRGIRSFRGGNFRAWLLSIVANACRDHLRAQRRHPTLSYDALPPPASTENHRQRVELEDVLHRGLASLPQEQRLAVVLSDVLGLSYEEMAQAMKCSLGTVRSRLSRGRARLRDFLVQQGELLPR